MCKRRYVEFASTHQAEHYHGKELKNHREEAPAELDVAQQSAAALTLIQSRCKLLALSRSFSRVEASPTLSRETYVMRLGKLILPRWGTLGREARNAARPSVAEKRCAHRVAASMPVLVYGHSAHAPFAEPTVTMYKPSDTANGVLIGLKVGHDELLEANDVVERGTR